MTSKEKIKETIKSLIPWQCRYYVKLLEAKYPSIHIPMKSETDIEHYNRMFYGFMEEFGDNHVYEGKVVCEMGCGQYLTHSAMLYQLGCVKSYMLEIADFADADHTKPITKYMLLKDGVELIRKLPSPIEGETWIRYLPKLNCEYYTDGLEGYKRIPENSIDYVYSDAVFEHIRKDIFRETMQEMHRFMKPGALACHGVELRDHMGGLKNQLRFPDKIWEDEIHYKMDNYTNRLSASDISRICEEVGLSVVKVERNKYEKMPIKRSRMASEFKDLSDDELMTSGFTIVLKK